MIPPDELLNALRREDRFSIITHISPDGDGLGSALALAAALDQAGKETAVYCRDAVPHQYRFLPRWEAFRPMDDVTDFQTLVLVDCNDLDRIGIAKGQAGNITFRSSIVIDHHESERPFGDIRWIEPHAAATGMMIERLIPALGLTINRDMALSLYTAIIVDTGNFRYENTTGEVLTTAARLVEAGAEPHLIAGEVFDSWTEGRFRLFIEVLGTLEIRDDVAFMTVTQEMLRKTKTSVSDVETFVSFPKILRNVKTAVLLREMDDGAYKVSLRSKNAVNVAKIAETLGGGGHKNAAGCKIRDDAATSRERLFQLIRSSARAPK